MLVIRDDEEYTSKLKADSAEHRQVITFTPHELVYGLYFMFEFNHSDDFLYEAWINYYCEDGQRMVDLLAEQKSIDLIFFSGEARQTSRITVELSDEFRSVAAHYQEICQKLEPWSHAAFNQLQEIVHTVYTNALARWTDLLGNGD